MLGLALLLLAWLIWRAMAHPNPVHAPPPQRPASAAERWNLTRPALAAASAATASAAALPADAPLWVMAADVPGPRRRTPVELCGAGRVVVDHPAAIRSADSGASMPESAQEADDPIQARLDQAWPRLVERLLAAPGPRAQAAGWLLAGHGPLPVAGVVDQAAASQGLVRLALAAGDAWVLQLALQHCGVQSPAAACAGLTARHWLQADRGNALAWVALWQQEPAAADEALHGMALARSADSGFGQLPALVAQHWPVDLPPYLLSAAVIRSFGVDAALVRPSLKPLIEICRAAVARGDANRRASCELAAELLVGSGRDLLTRGMGLAVGRVLDWGPERRQMVDAARQAASDGALRDGLLPLTDSYSCASVTRLRSNLRSLAERGEVEYWLAWQRGRR